VTARRLPTPAADATDRPRRHHRPATGTDHAAAATGTAHIAATAAAGRRRRDHHGRPRAVATGYALRPAVRGSRDGGRRPDDGREARL
jgi:hypothetical protein